ncbi:hypothetical protein [Kitasatospora cathayae]|uniref:Uncharacterized protein n=1 Tax=Kitasatospora cathayae TaxID=3004092 RepID=A0ABY7Q9W3_9ACTN|nr:hypothetical protein [Kitasatospora sp. HUAS 3-15]WBP89480.1 hypothetical protein O1G21_29015 [Kitasatospora sp. HUAS 3-15]
MSDYSQYEPLVALAAAHDTEVEVDSYLWASLYEYAEGGEVPAPRSIVEITELRAVSPEGWASVDVALVARLGDGRWATCVAWADTTGFGCRYQVDWRINPTREQAVAFGLDEESRRALRLSLPG